MDGIILYTSQYAAISRLSIEQKGRLLDCIFLKALGEPIDISDDPVLAMAFSFVEERMDSNAAKYEQIVEKRREAGRKGGLKRVANYQANQANASVAKQIKQNQANQANAYNNNNNNNNNKTDNVPNGTKEEEDKRENNIKREKEQKKFVKPTIEEIRVYCNERKNGISPEMFYDFYESKGWMVGKNKMKDWKACVRTWEKSKKPMNNMSIGVNWHETKNHYEETKKQLW